MSEHIRLEDVLNEDRVSVMLRRGGLSPEAVPTKAAMLRRCAETLTGWGNKGSSPVGAFYVPGRIEVLGKHTDYAGGRSVVAATERGFCILVAPRQDRTIRIMALEPAEESRFEFSPDLNPPVGHWSNYPMTVARRLARNFPGELLGADMAFGSDLPPAAGMSSSSALMISIFLALDRINGLRHRDPYPSLITSPEDLAGYLATIENGQSFGDLAGDKGVGTFGGSEDHTAILCCSCGVMNLYSYCPVRFEKYLPMPSGMVFTIASSGVVAEKTRDALEKYNRASRRAAAAAELWRQGTGRKEPHLAAIYRSMPQAVGKLREILQQSHHNEFQPQDLLSRMEQFLAESEQIIPAASNALMREDLTEFGKQVDRSQQLTDELLGNQIPETIALARLARQHGAIAASAFGAGFGGSVWAMIESEKAESFIDRWRRSYGEAYPEPARNSSFFSTTAGPAAFELGG